MHNFSNLVAKATLTDVCKHKMLYTAHLSCHSAARPSTVHRKATASRKYNRWYRTEFRWEIFGRFHFHLLLAVTTDDQFLAHCCYRFKRYTSSAIATNPSPKNIFIIPFYRYHTNKYNSRPKIADRRRIQQPVNPTNGNKKLWHKKYVVAENRETILNSRKMLNKLRINGILSSKIR